MEIELFRNEYMIKIFEDITFTENSTDNLHKYDHIVRFDDNSYTISKHGIQVLKDSELVGTAILLGAGGGTAVHQNGFIVNGENILCCAGNVVFCLGLPRLETIWKSKVDEATAFGIYELGSDFLVHGELSISRITSEGKIVWQYYGSDIFVLESGEGCVFIQKDKTVIAESWDGRKYHFDHDGHEIL